MNPTLTPAQYAFVARLAAWTDAKRAKLHDPTTGGREPWQFNKTKCRDGSIRAIRTNTVKTEDGRTPDTCPICALLGEAGIAFWRVDYPMLGLTEQEAKEIVCAADYPSAEEWKRAQLPTIYSSTAPAVWRGELRALLLAAVNLSDAPGVL